MSEAASVGGLLSPAARARIAAEQAQTYAVLGLRTECRHALEQAHQAADEITNEDRVGLFSDWSTARLSVYEGTCWLFLAEPKMAVKVLEEALQVLVLRHPNLALAARVDLGSARAEEGELEEGCRILRDTYVDLANMGNSRGVQRARCARERLEPWKEQRPVRELDELMNSIAIRQ